MKKALSTFCLALALSTTGAFGGDGKSGPIVETPTQATASRFPFEFEAEYAYIADSDVARGARDVRDFDETYSLLRFVYTPRVSFGILRFGATWEYFTFGFPAGVQLPDVLQSVSAVVGLDTQFSDSILVRIEAQPGYYGTDDVFRGDNFNVPFIIGGSYIYSSDLQIVLGASVNFEREYPVLPGGGLRWRLASQWVLNAVLPTPRLEFEASSNMTFFAGANIKASTFRVGKNFGTMQAGDFRLDHAKLDYIEARVGIGAELKLSPEVKLTFEGGYVPWREFDYHRTPVRYHHESGAPYATIAFRAAF